MEQIDIDELQEQDAPITLSHLEVGYRVLDFEDFVFGTITAVIEDPAEPEWNRIEVEWERDDGIVDKSFVLADTTIGVEITPSHDLFHVVAANLGDKVSELQEEFGDDLVMLGLARW